MFHLYDYFCNTETMYISPRIRSTKNVGLKRIPFKHKFEGFRVYTKHLGPRTNQMCVQVIIFCHLYINRYKYLGSKNTNKLNIYVYVKHHYVCRKIN